MAPSPTDTVEAWESLGRVRVALESLDLPHRAVFVLFELQGESCDDIAAGLGIPTGTVYSRLHKARKQFTEAYARVVGRGPIPVNARNGERGRA